MLRRVHWAPTTIAITLGTWAIVTGCQPESTLDIGYPMAQGGTNTGLATGGAVNTNGGNAYLQGGQNNPSQGGSSTSAQGGSSSKGGGTATGGSATGNGGSTAKGGATGKGGTTTSTGGAAVSATGGAATTATGGNANTGKAVTFSAGKAVGAMTGYGYVALGSATGYVLTEPTCGASKVAITGATPCASGTNWPVATSLCMTGSIPVNDPPAYTTNWGMAIGVNATDPATGGLGQTFTSVTFTVTGTPTAGLRAQVHRVGDPEGTNYCFEGLKSGVAIPLTSFNTECWTTPTPATAKSITAADVPNIDKISVQVSSSTTAAVTVSNLCLTAIDFT